MSLTSSTFWSELLKKVLIANKMQTNLADIEAELQTLLKAKLSTKIQIYLFGSRVLGIAQETSDLDIFVKFEDSFYEYTDNPPTRKTIVRQAMIAKVFNSRCNWKRIEQRRGRCPIVIIQNRFTGLQCDINCSDAYAYFQNKIVLYLFELQPIARYMIIYLRDWIRKHGQQDMFRSHLLLLMLIFFLQIREHLPGIHVLQAGLSPQIGPVICDFNKLKSLNEPCQIALTEQNVRAQLKEFFKFYGSFDFDRYAICPYLGTYVERRFLNASMPKRYQMVNMDSKFTRFTVAIQDFIHLNFNKEPLRFALELPICDAVTPNVKPST
ncbi:terminal uridylyltransferase Tailor-like [Drosophila hydei]|uniref:Terminal uridylyltransferase Tailor-like n=1 Tax=Drosophila hydei TaxID=7224 RepID=A0A6J1L824_DROHY|nr:terminal uridylyltransferase Tailor-like [Drosophila hydei]